MYYFLPPDHAIVKMSYDDKCVRRPWLCKVLFLPKDMEIISVNSPDGTKETDFLLNSLFPPKSLSSCQNLLSVLSVESSYPPVLVHLLELPMVWITGRGI